MRLTHEKVSGLANTDAGKVGGENWDDPHVLEAGSVVTCAVLGFAYTVSGSVTTPTNNVGPISSSFTKTSTGHFDASIDTSAYPVRAGYMVVTYIGAVSISGLPAGWTWFASSNYGSVSLEIYNASGVLANPTSNIKVFVTIIGQVE